MGDELRRSYHDRLGELHAEVTRLVGLAADAADEATAEIAEGTSRRAGAITAGAEETGERHTAVEAEVFDLLALQAPVARDLRLVLASLRVAHEAQMSHNLAATAARRSSVAAPISGDSRVGVLLADAGRQAAGLLRAAGEAFSVLDPALAAGVIDADGPVRDAHRELLGALFTLDAAPVEAAVEAGVIARCYQRIADHAVEVAARVRFVALGDLTS